MDTKREVGAVVLAAGRSQRMGQPKLGLPWGERTVIGQVVETLTKAGIEEILVVTGGAREVVEKALAGYPVRFVYNSVFDQEEMMTSLKAGIRDMSTGADGLLVVLGDQPTIEVGVVRAVLQEFSASDAPLVIPSYQKRRGHPWLIGKSLWGEILDFSSEKTMRDFLNLHREKIHYVNVQSRGILQDLDTPEDYEQLRPE